MMMNKIMLLISFVLIVGCSGGYDQAELENISNDLEIYADSVVQAEIDKNLKLESEHNKLLSDSISAIDKELNRNKEALKELEAELILIIRDNDEQDIAYEKKAEEIRLMRDKIKAAENYLKQLSLEMNNDSTVVMDTLVNNIYHTIEKSDNKMLGVYVILGLFVLVVLLAIWKTSSNTKKDIV